MTLQDLLYLSGGIKQSAEFGRLEISSIVDIDSAKQGLKPTRTVVRSYAILPNLVLDSAAANVMLRPFDQVFVRKNPTFEMQQNIELRGLVKYPGLYPRLSKFERLSSFIGRAGGFKDNANLAGAVLFRNKTEFFREKVVIKPKLDSLGQPILDSSTRILEAVDEPVSIDLFKAMSNKNSKHDIILQENDVVFIPEINPFVTVQGSVQSPLKIAFDREHSNLMYYIDKAGGFGIKPWKKRVFVTYANGKSRRTRNFGFFNVYPRVEEGSTVNVPPKPKGQDMGDLLKSVLVASVPVILTGIIFKYVN
jgi:protein involved in polysaccharide export with SLBB domain